MKPYENQMNRSTFKEQFIVTFLASWAGSNYNEHCLYDTQNVLEYPPVEDAILLADAAWEEYMNHLGIKEVK